MTEEPRRDLVYNLSGEFLLKLGVAALPVNPLELIACSRWGLVTYTELCGLLPGAKTAEDIAEACRSSDGFTVKSRGGYCIAYNDTVKVKSRVAFTLMHEAGHIVCGHFTGRTSSLGAGEYRALEAEANFFASNALAPAAVAVDCELTTAELLQAACGISHSAAAARLKELSGWQPRPIDEKIRRAFASYIRVARRLGLSGAEGRFTSGLS